MSKVELLPIIKLINDTITEKGFISQKNIVKLHYDDIQAMMEAYANQRVVEELEEHASNMTEYNKEVRSSVVVTAIQEDMLNSIKQLKQK